jgi:hypothetical protein
MLGRIALSGRLSLNSVAWSPNPATTQADKNPDSSRWLSGLFANSQPASDNGGPGSAYPRPKHRSGGASQQPFTLES